MTVPKWLDDETLYYSTTQRPAGWMVPDAPVANRATSARRLEAHRDTPPVVPQPLAVDCVVVVDYPSRTLYARLPDSLTGLGRSHWTQAWQRLSWMRSAAGQAGRRIYGRPLRLLTGWLG
jgi:hypothetical protein